MVTHVRYCTQAHSWAEKICRPQEPVPAQDQLRWESLRVIVPWVSVAVWWLLSLCVEVHQRSWCIVTCPIYLNTPDIEWPLSTHVSPSKERWEMQSLNTSLSLQVPGHNLPFVHITKSALEGRIEMNEIRLMCAREQKTVGCKDNSSTGLGDITNGPYITLLNATLIVFGQFMTNACSCMSKTRGLRKNRWATYQGGQSHMDTSFISRVWVNHAWLGCFAKQGYRVKVWSPIIIRCCVLWQN